MKPNRALTWIPNFWDANSKNRYFGPYFLRARHSIYFCHDQSSLCAFFSLPLLNSNFIRWILIISPFAVLKCLVCLVGRGVYEYYMDEAIFQSMLSLETFWNYIQIYIERIKSKSHLFRSSTLSSAETATAAALWRKHFVDNNHALHEYQHQTKDKTKQQSYILKCLCFFSCFASLFN